MTIIILFVILNFQTKGFASKKAYPLQIIYNKIIETEKFTDVELMLMYNFTLFTYDYDKKTISYIYYEKYDEGTGCYLKATFDRYDKFLVKLEKKTYVDGEKTNKNLAGSLAGWYFENNTGIDYDPNYNGVYTWHGRNVRISIRLGGLYNNLLYEEIETF